MAFDQLHNTRRLLTHITVFFLLIPLSACSSFITAETDPIIANHTPPTCLIEGPFWGEDAENYLTAARATGSIGYNLNREERKYLRPFPLGRTYKNARTKTEEGETTLTFFKTPEPLNFATRIFNRVTPAIYRAFNEELPEPSIHQFPIDSSISKLWIKVDAIAPTVVELTSNTGALVTQKISDTQYIQDYQQSCIISIDKPKFGYWTLSIRSEEPVFALVKARSSIRFTHFTYADNEAFYRHGNNFFLNNPPETGAFDGWLGKEENPLKETVRAGAIVTGEKNVHSPEISFSTRSLDGTIIEEIDAIALDNKTYRLDYLTPSLEEHYIHVEGRDRLGKPFERRYPASIQVFTSPTPMEQIPYDTPYPDDTFIR